MSTASDEQPSLRDRLRYSGPHTSVPEAEPRLYYCTYCLRELCLLPHEFRICQTCNCLEQAIEDRKERIFEIQLSVPAVHRELVKQKAELVGKVAELALQDPDSLALAQYRAVLSAVNADLGFYASNESIDRILSLKEQIRELSKRLARPSFSEAFRRQLWERDRKTCYLCRLEVLHWEGNSMHIDHVKARSQGGSDEAHNLRVAHPRCNLIKADRELAERRMKAILEELRGFEKEDARTALF